MIIANCICLHSMKRLVFAKKVQRAYCRLGTEFLYRIRAKKDQEITLDSMDFKVHKVVKW
jgi:hypothetical protein